MISAGSNPAISNASLYLMVQIVVKDAVYAICELMQEHFLEKIAADPTPKIDNPETKLFVGSEDGEVTHSANVRRDV